MAECKIGRGADSDRKSSYLLTVDSDVNELFYTSMLLQRFEYNSCTETKGTDAFDMAIAASPSLIITELDLSDMPGLELIQRLKNDVRTASIPVIVKSVGLTPELERHYRSAGVAAFVHSPVLAEDLFHAVQNTIETTPRSNIRIHTRLPVIINGKALECTQGECVSELSEFGMFVRTLQGCPLNTLVSVQFTVKDRSLSAEAQVLYCRHFGQVSFKEPGVAFKFLHLDPSDRVYIRAYIEEELMKGIIRK